jgi:hypothetical protein
MPDCSADLRAFYASRVALPNSWLGEMRTKRDRVRALLKRRLRDAGITGPIIFRMQGSVAMGTVIRGGHYGSYDIDDGVYLESAALLGPRGGEMSALSVRELVCEAVQHPH